jgi:hypothetical protein
MRRREFISVLGYATSWPIIASAQQAKRIRRIGAVMDAAEIDATRAWAAAFETGLDAAGWHKGHNCARSLIGGGHLTPSVLLTMPRS